MTSVRPVPVYEDELTYPMVVNHRIVEVSGRVINNWKNSEPKTLSVGEYYSLINRIEQLEKQLNNLPEK